MGYGIVKCFCGHTWPFVSHMETLGAYEGESYCGSLKYKPWKWPLSDTYLARPPAKVKSVFHQGVYVRAFFLTLASDSWSIENTPGWGKLLLVVFVLAADTLLTAGLVGDHREYTGESEG